MHMALTCLRGSSSPCIARPHLPGRWAQPCCLCLVVMRYAGHGAQKTMEFFELINSEATEECLLGHPGRAAPWQPGIP